MNKTFSYNEITGVLSRLKAAPNAPIGPCGLSTNSSGYLQVRYKGVKYPQHRVIWKIMTGDWPVEQVDHINGIRTDNRWVNLRDVSSKENSKNRRNQVNNLSGISGINWCNRSDMWLVRINVDGTRVHLGYFDTLMNAAIARHNAERKYGYHENHGCTTFRPSSFKGAILTKVERVGGDAEKGPNDKGSETVVESGGSCIINPETGERSCAD